MTSASEDLGAEGRHPVTVHVPSPLPSSLESGSLRSDLTKVARTALERLGAADHLEVSIVLGDDELLRGLNRRYRQKDRVTDVLTFPAGEGDRLDGIEGPFPSSPVGGRGQPASAELGDILISVAQAVRNAEANDWSPAEELRLLVVHGILHLLGYDDEDPAGTREMERLERELGVRP